MRVLFVASGNKDQISPIIQNQGEALMSEGVELSYFLIRGRGFAGYMSNIIPLRKYLKERSFEVVHAHYSLSAFVASLAGAKPLVVSLMGSDVKASVLYNFLISFFAVLFRWKAIIVKSLDMYRDLGIQKAHIIPNGVNLERFYPMDKTECQNRLGWDNTSKHILFPAEPNRPEKDYALAQMSVNLLGENVILHHFNQTPNEETPYWYNAADVVLLTSKWEGSPNAIKEAMACNRPIVSTAVGDVKERMKGVEGCFVVEKREPQAISNSLAKALAFSTTQGREKIREDKLDNENISKVIIQLYEIAATP